jgi:hypothetical protein
MLLLHLLSSLHHYPQNNCFGTPPKLHISDYLTHSEGVFHVR